MNSLSEETSRWIRQLASQLEETNALLRVLVRISLHTLESQTSDKIDLLNQLGLRPTEIARILGTSSNAVSVQLYRLRKKGQALGEKAIKEASNQ